MGELPGDCALLNQWKAEVIYGFSASGIQIVLGQPGRMLVLFP